MHSEPGPHSSRAGLPQGLLEETAKSFLEAAHYPSEPIAQIGALALLAGVTGKAYNTPTGAGLNLYLMLLASSGSGKDIISRGAAIITASVLPTVPSFIDFRGPGELVSAAGLIKALECKPCFLAVIGEFGKKFEIMVNPKAPVHERSLYRALLQLFSKSGAGEVFDPIAYSDRDKNTGTIQSPSLTLIGESVPETFYEALGEGLITDGLLSRFLIVEAKGPRPYRNAKADGYQLPDRLVQGWSELGAHCLSQMHRGVVQRVAWLPEAEAKFDQYERWTTDEINRAAGEGARQLWNRAYLKALKLASLAAVGENYVSPQITLSHALWATDLVAGQTSALIARFTNGEVGEQVGNEAKQINEVIRVIFEYASGEYARFEKYGGTFEMHRDGVVTEAYIQRRLITLKAFKPKPTLAIKQALKSLLEADDLREMPKSQMLANYGNGARSFVIANPRRFIPAV